MSKIIVDHREPKQLIRELAKDLEIEVKQLITADVIIQTKNKQKEEVLIGIERKTTNDFLNSIIDKRILSQIIYLKENFQIPILIIEGQENIYMLRNFHPNSIRGMLASIAIDFQIPMLQTRNYRDTASLIKIMAKRLEKPKSVISLLKKRKPLTTKELQEYIIESLPTVGPVLAKNMLKVYKTVKSVINAKDLEKVEGLGKKRAEEIIKVLEEAYKED